MRKKPQPVLLECITFRMRGHEEASGTKYVPKKLMEEWGKKDPVENYEKFLISESVIDQKQIDTLRKKIKQEIESGLAEAFEETLPEADTSLELSDVYSPFVQEVITPESEKNQNGDSLILSAMDCAKAWSVTANLVLMGQDIADYGGVFKITEGFVEKFGKDRVRNTPLCEAAIVGTSLGLSIKGMKAMVEMQFADFVTEGFNQIINNLSQRHIGVGANRPMWLCACLQVLALLRGRFIVKVMKRGSFTLPD
jgi:2-oxoisovalerate dehydrogenase E1 component